jgi:STE24 endopeptidase
MRHGVAMMMRHWIGGSLVLLVLLAPLPLLAATGFDVEAATRAYLDTLTGPAREKSDAYFEGGYWITLWGALIGMAADFFLLRFRLSAAMRDLGERLFKRRAGAVWLTGLLYTLIGALITLPWTIYTGFFRERDYGLMNMELAGWAGEYLTDLAISLVLMPLVILAIYAIIRRAPRRWWIGGSLFSSLFLIVGIVLAPVYISPLFNTYTELPAGPVRDRIVAMAKAHDVPADHIYLFDASKQSKRISANVSGLGPTIRISLNDNLLNRTSEEEIAAVMGHELGHYVLNHVWSAVLLLSLILTVAMLVVARVAPWLITRFGARWGVRELADPASLPVFGLVLGAVFLIAQPLITNVIRMNESAADTFGLEAAREPDGFARVAMRLSEYRKIEPGPIEEILFYDHPSGATRVRMAMEWKVQNVPGAIIVTPPPMTGQ